MSLSVIITCKNESDNIKACLESVKWADEIVIVDNGSTDNTLDICKQYTDKIIYSENPFTGMRVNEGIEAVSGDWVLNIDADERLEPALIEEIKQTVNDQDNIQAFDIPFKHYFMNQHLEHWSPKYVKRLYRKDKAKYNAASHHVQVDVEGRTAKLKNHIIHLSPGNIEKVVTKTNLYSSNMVKFSKPQKATIIDLTIRPFWIFIKKYFIKKGYKDGMPGFIISALMGFMVFIDAAKWIEYKINIKKSENI